MVSEFEIKKQICDIGKRIYDRGMVAANDGNISVKISENEFLCTPTGVSKGFMTPEYICKVDRDGNVIQANGNFKPSSEIKMHMRVYKHRPDVGAVVHAHPSYATSFAIAGIPLTQPIMPEAVIGLGCVPIAPYGTPSTMEIPDAIEKLYEIRRQMGLPGKHPANLCAEINKGNPAGCKGCHSCAATSCVHPENKGTANIEAIVAEVTKRVLSQM